MTSGPISVDWGFRDTTSYLLLTVRYYGRLIATYLSYVRNIVVFLCIFSVPTPLVYIFILFNTGSRN